MSIAARSAAAVPDRALVEAALRDFFAAGHADIAAVYLFGSVARGQARPGSDVDIALLYREDPPRTLASVPAALETELTRLLGVPANVIALNHAPIDLAYRVLRDGILVADRDRSRRIAFEIRARNRYWDMLPILKRYRNERLDRP